MFLWIIVTVTLLIIQNLIMNIRNANKIHSEWVRGYKEGREDGYHQGYEVGFECSEGGGEYESTYP